MTAGSEECLSAKDLADILAESIDDHAMRPVDDSAQLIGGATVEASSVTPTQSVRAFTPGTSIVTPSSIHFTRQIDVTNMRIYATDPLYPILTWPLAFPQGVPIADDQGRPLGIADSTS